MTGSCALAQAIQQETTVLGIPPGGIIYPIGEDSDVYGLYWSLMEGDAYLEVTLDDRPSVLAQVSLTDMQIFYIHDVGEYFLKIVHVIHDAYMRLADEEKQNA